MRSLPRTSRHRSIQLVSACAALLLASTAALAPSATADDLKKRKQQVQSAIGAAKGDLQESSKALTAAARRLKASSAALTAAQKKLLAAESAVSAAAAVDAQMQARLVQAQQALVTARADLEKARAHVREQRRAIGELAANTYATGDPALVGLTVILNSQSPAEATAQMSTVDSLMDRQSNTLDDLRDARANLVEREAGVQKAQEAVAEQRQNAAANLARTQGLQQAAASVRSQVAGLVTSSRASQDQALRARQADARELRALKAQENRIKQLIITRARSQRGGFKGDAGGFLYRPVSGYVTSPYGWRVHPIYGYWGLHDGTDFHAPCGTPLRASGHGTVVARTASTVYGNRLYLDLGQVNGSNLTVVYNHASSYRYGVGAKVSRGAVLGYAGSTGWSTACHLHFSVLRNGNPVDPMGYL